MNCAARYAILQSWRSRERAPSAFSERAPMRECENAETNPLRDIVEQRHERRAKDLECQ